MIQMFTGNEPTSPTKYETTSSDEQLQLVKEMGKILYYPGIYESLEEDIARLTFI